MKKILKDYLIIFLGSVLLAIPTAGLIIPNNIGAGGVTGIALGLNNLTGMKVGTLSILINVPLFIFGFNLLGKSFSFKSAFSVLVYSVTLDILPNFFNFTSLNDTLLASTFSGAIVGVSLYMIFFVGGSTAGLDILAKILNNKFKNLSLSKILFILDIIVYAFVGIVMGPRSAMYALVLSFIRSKTMDALQEGLLSSRQCIVICNDTEKMVKSLQEKLQRGVTVLKATGAYSNVEKGFVYIVIQKGQLRELKNLVNEVEPSAFVTVSPVNEIIGTYRNHYPI